MRDSRTTRIVLGVLLLLSVTLVALDLRAGGGPFDGLRRAAAGVFGPVEEAVAGVLRPITGFFGGGSAADKDARIAELEAEITRLRESGSPDAARRIAELDALLRTAGAGQYRIVAARVIAAGASQDFAWTVTLDAGSRDGIAPEMTVVSGAGLVGRVASVTDRTATVVLIVDPTTTVGARLEGSGQIGFLSGTGREDVLRLRAVRSAGPDEGGGPAGDVRVAGRQAVRARGADRGGHRGEGHTRAADPQGDGPPVRRRQHPGPRRCRRPAAAHRPPRRRAPAAADRERDGEAHRGRHGLADRRPDSLRRAGHLWGSPERSGLTLDLRFGYVRFVHPQPGGRRDAGARVTAPRVAFAALLVLVAALVQVTLLSRLGLPGATPDLVLVVVLALAFVRGPTAGAGIGFGAGLLVDVIPPADGPLGLSALLLALAGYAAGRFVDRTERSALAPLVATAVIAPLVVLARALMLGLVGDPRVVWPEVPWLLVTESLWAVLLAAFVIPFVAAVDRRLEPDPMRRLR